MSGLEWFRMSSATENELSSISLCSSSSDQLRLVASSGLCSHPLPVRSCRGRNPIAKLLDMFNINSGGLSSCKRQERFEEHLVD